jgi:dCTP deaminase
VLLSNRDILEETDFDNIIIQPFRRELMQPSSYDVTLSCEFKVQLKPEPGEVLPDIDPQVDSSEYFSDVAVPKGQAIAIEPGAFVLGSIHEVISLGANIAARCEGKSSLGRLGLQVHSTAGFIDPGFEGNITLELSNNGTMPILLWPGMKIGQLCFFRLPSPATILYGSRFAGSHYQNQSGPTTSRSFDKFKIYDVYNVDSQEPKR